MKVFILGLTLLVSMSSYASDALSKKCIELGGESFGHASCMMKIKLKPNPNPLTLRLVSNEIMDEQKPITDELSKACSEAALNNPNAVMSISYSANDVEASMSYFCFISIE